LAKLAAKAVPHQSITYAQVLDTATLWLIDRDPEADAKPGLSVTSSLLSFALTVSMADCYRQEGHLDSIC